ncbi:D-alanyl-D-alanine carboxypeptidase [Saccharothrix sp. CB00851]|nr:D-alanyl-D-alanine carboxypeptidase [Saccharothrix sp. CB00851]
MMVAVLGLATAGTAHAGHRTDTTTLQRHADALLDQGAPGVLVEVDTPRGAVRVRSGYGDVDRRTPVPWRVKFRIGSYTKTFVAATVLQLVDEGRLSLEDSVERWLPGAVAGNGNDGTRITVRQLLQHTSGLTDYVGKMPELFLEEEFEKNRFRTYRPEQLVALALQSPPDFPPGEGWNYSNTGYVLAGMIIERVTGNTWQHEVRTRIVEPLGLRDTSLPGTSPFLPRPHATAYERFPEKGLEADPEDPRWGRAVDVTRYNPSWGGAAGDMISTTEDANEFLQALIGGKVLRPAQLAEMTKTVRTPGLDPAWPGAEYGLGIMWIPNSCGGHWSHGGDIPGFKTRNGVTADGRRSVVVSINTDSMVAKPGAPKPTGDVTSPLIDHALCDLG